MNTQGDEIKALIVCYGIAKCIKRNKYSPHTSEGGVQIYFLINRKMPLELAEFEPGAAA